MPRLLIKKEDLVQIITGKDKGKKGKVIKAFPLKQKVVVEKINIVKRHTKPRTENQEGGIIEKEMPIHVSNVMILCGKCNRPVRSGHKTLENNKKVRICKKCGEILERN